MAADILLLTGYARMHLSRYDEAVADLDEAESLFTRHRPDARYERWRTHLHRAAIARVRAQPEVTLRHARASEALSRTGPGFGISERVDSLYSLGIALYYNQDEDAAVAHFRQALDELAGTELEGSAQHLELLNAVATSRTRNDTEGAEVQRQAEQRLQLAERLYAGDQGRIAHTWAQVSKDLMLVPGQAGRALDLARRAQDAASRVFTGPHYNKTNPACNLGEHLAFAGQWQTALPYYDAGIDNARSVDQRDYGQWACLRGRGYAKAALGRLEPALQDMREARAVMAGLGDTGSWQELDDCGLLASVLLRLRRIDEAGTVLRECVGSSQSDARHWRMARAEWLHRTGAGDEATRITDALRREYAPSPLRRNWMRPWMLSALLAHEAGDGGAIGQWSKELGEHAALEPLASCLSRPSEANCLTFP